MGVVYHLIKINSNILSTPMIKVIIFCNFVKNWEFVMQNEEEKFGITQSIQIVF